MPRAHPTEVCCSFCRRPQHQVKHLIAQAGVHICNECVRQFRQLLRQPASELHSACDCSQPFSQAAAHIVAHTAAHTAAHIADCQIHSPP